MENFFLPTTYMSFAWRIHKCQHEICYYSKVFLINVSFKLYFSIFLMKCFNLFRIFFILLVQLCFLCIYIKKDEFLFCGMRMWLTIDYHFRKCKRPVGEENEENKKGKRKRAAETEIVVSTKEKEVSAVETKRKTMEHTLTRCDTRLPKITPIIDDYEISNHVLGLGINGKVVQCYDKNTREKYALKVR